MTEKALKKWFADLLGEADISCVDMVKYAEELDLIIEADTKQVVHLIDGCNTSRRRSNFLERTEDKDEVTCKHCKSYMKRHNMI